MPEMWIFDRPGAGHAWERALSELEAPPSPPGDQAVAESWRMDRRVCPEREGDLLAQCQCGDSPGASSWRRGLSRYFEHHLCRPWEDHPAGRPSNAANRIAGRVSPHDQLLHVASLNRILSFLGPRSGEDFKAEFRRLVGLPFPDRRPGDGGAPLLPPVGFRVDEIAAVLTRRGPAAVQRLAGFLVTALGENQPLWWASFAEEVVVHLAARDGGGLCKALGLGHLNTGEWLLAWQYPVMAAGPLLRPTVVEAGDSPFHHPSPPGFPWGITLPLVDGWPRCREVVHRPLRGLSAASLCTGVLVPVEDQPTVYNQVLELRQTHRAGLRDEFPSPVAQAWLTRYERAS